MALGRPLSPLTLVPAERQQLLEWTRRPKTAQALALRACIVLLSAEGRNNTEVARRVRVTLATVGKWRKRFLLLRLDGLLDEPHPGTRRRLSDAEVERVLARTLGKPIARRHPLVHALSGPRGWAEPEQHQPHLARLFPAAAPQPSFQTESRSAVHRQSPRHRRPLPQPARPRLGAVRGREEPDSGAGPHGAASAHAPG